MNQRRIVTLLLALLLGLAGGGFAFAEETDGHLLVTLSWENQALTVTDVITVKAPLPKQGRRVPGFAPYQLVVVEGGKDLRVEALPNLGRVSVPPLMPGMKEDAVPASVKQSKAVFAVRLPRLEQGQSLELRQREQRAKGDSNPPAYKALSSVRINQALVTRFPQLEAVQASEVNR